jgi:DNA-binding response OmpR family regulator
MQTLLLIEDNPTQAAQFKKVFEKLGYQVILFYSGKHGLNYLQNLSSQNLPYPNLIVLTFNLSGEDSLGICQQLKLNIKFRPIPLFIYSAENKLATMTAAYQAGADYYIVKETEGKESIEPLVDALLKRQLRRQQQPYNSNHRTATSNFL